jgi:hypothetical protein
MPIFVHWRDAMIRRAAAVCASSVLFLVLLAGAPAGAADGVVLQLGERPPENPASVTGGGSVVPRFSDRSRDQLMVPMFKINRTSATAETTLIAVRNVTGQAHDVVISYFVDHVFSAAVLPDHVETFSLAAEATRTINLRDRPQLTGGQGSDAIIRGWVLVEHGDAGTGDVLSADYFRVDDAQNFATGERMVDVDASYTCTVWDLRYVAGGAFSGGTRLEVFIDTPLGFATPSFAVNFFDEPGNALGTVTVSTTLQVVELNVAQLLDLLPGSPSPFGAMEIFFQPGTNGGLVRASYRAQGKFSVGLDGTCVMI